MTPRIQGLVKAFRRIRDELRHGIPLQQQGHFRIEVIAILSRVEEICAGYETTPDALPTPSRNAYHFLKNIDLNHLPTPNTTTSSPPAHPPVRVQNVVKIGNRLVKRLWQKLDALLESPLGQKTMQREFSLYSKQIRNLCEQANSRPSQLELPSRRMYCWMSFLAEDKHLQTHLEALLRARQLAHTYISSPNHHIEIQLLHMNALWRLRTRNNTSVLKCNEGFLHAPEDVWDAIVGGAFSRKTRARQCRIEEYSEQDDFRHILRTIDSYASPGETATQGQHFDLVEVFARVNQIFFDGNLEQPQLRWNRTITTRKFGHYQPSGDTLMLSITLDSPDIPTYVIDFVMYHELLHKKHGIITRNGRRIAHTNEFRRDERKFPQYHEAENFLQRLSTQLDSPRR